jgi:tetratricopeptide (TPR) repeat protein
MKRQNILITMMILFITMSSTYGQWIFRPIDPNNSGYRYGKSPYSGAPFLYFGSTAYQYHISNSQYNSYLTSVDAAFTSWNNSGQVQFSRSTSGLTLTAQAQNYSTYGPAWSFPSWNASTLELTPASGSIVLNSSSNVTWRDDQQHLNASPHVLDVQTMVVHEAGHIHGLAHPLTASYTHDATAPTMAGGDNAYFDNTLDCRSLETNDVYGTRFLQLRVPSLYSNLQTALNKNAEIGVGNVYVVSNYSLTSNISIPSGATLTLLSGVNIDLNGFYILLDGGAINNYGNITCTYLMQGGVLKGLFPTIQSAVNYSSSGQTVSLQSRTHNESFTLSSKSGVTISGGGISNTTINGSVNFSSSQGCTLTNLTVSNNISLSYGTNNNYLATLKVLGNIQPNIGSYSDIRWVDLTTANNAGIIAGYSHAYIFSSSIKNKSAEGIYATGMNLTAEAVTLCTNGPSGNRLDVLSTNSSPDIYLHSCLFSRSVEGSTVAGTYIHWDWWGYCGGLSKSAANADNIVSLQIKELSSDLDGLSNENKLAGQGDYENVIVNYRSLFDRIRKENDGKIIDFKQYEKELTDIISQFKDVMKKYPSSVSSVQSLQEVISCYRLLQNQQSAKQIVNDLLADIKYAEVFSHIKFLALPLFIDEQNYDAALSLCDVLLSEIPNTSEAAVLLYNKGIIFKTLKNDKANAEKMYNQLIEQYPNSMYANLVAESLGKETIPQTSKSVQKLEKYELNNYPNPFNPSTVISYQLPAISLVKLIIYDLLGREVATLANGIQEAGNHTATFDGSGLSSGFYFVRFIAQPADGSAMFNKTMKILLTK